MAASIRLGSFRARLRAGEVSQLITRSERTAPDLDDWMRNNDPGVKKSALQTLVDDTLSTRVLTEADRVQDNMPLSFGDTGLILYEAEDIPEAFTWRFLAVRSSRDARTTPGLRLVLPGELASIACAAQPSV